jgi:ATP adenylyltransferase
MAEQRIWAPWRLEYIRGPKEGGCIFCLARDGDDDRERLVVHRGERAFVLLNAYPYASGHVMVAPYEHVPTIEELDEPGLTEMMTLSQRSLAALREVYSPDGHNLGINHGKVAGAGYADHVHLHVVPRWEGDNNFMPVVADTRVIPQALEDAWEQLREAWN